MLRPATVPVKGLEERESWTGPRAEHWIPGRPTECLAGPCTFQTASDPDTPMSRVHEARNFAWTRGPGMGRMGIRAHDR